MGNEEGFHTNALHGGRNQETRLRVLEDFRTGYIRLLVATDVMGRGIDVPNVTHVVVFEMGGVDDYVHRIGRTGRGVDAKGHALVFFQYYPKTPEVAAELIALLERSQQQVPDGLRKIAEEVAAGTRDTGWGSWGGGGGGGGGQWKDDQGWK